jgi:hypothetical protein
MPELERFKLTLTMLVVPFGFNLFMVSYFFILTFLLLMGAGPYENTSLEWQLLTFLPPASLVVNTLSIPLLVVTVQKDLRRQLQACAAELPAGRSVLWYVFLAAGLLCTGMLYLFVFIPMLWGWTTGSF